MGYKSILVPLEESEVLTSVLATTLLVGRQFDSYIEGLCIRPSLAGAIAVGFEGGVAALAGTEEQFEQEQETRTRRLQEQFDAFVRDNGLSVAATADTPGLCARWHEDEAPGIGIFGQRGRVFDLIVVGRPTPGVLTPAMNTLETVLFESGRPVLIAPPTVPQTLARNVVVAWNGSTETARAMAFAMPFLQNAERITVLTVEGALVPGPSGEEVAESLSRHGVTAEAVNAMGKRSPAAAGVVMIEEAAKLGADLIIKGGYTQSRLRQMIFGGATSHILNEAEIPVLMAH
ncbi:MAG: universal stress protein [Alphaproteobacteria bacterium]|nr:universal stress protein [Alphaproteobacteria bacterium]